MIQFCDAVCVLESASAINHLLTVDRRKAHLVAHILAILSHVMRTRAENVSVVQDILASKGSSTHSISLSFRDANLYDTLRMKVTLIIVYRYQLDAFIIQS